MRAVGMEACRTRTRTSARGQELAPIGCCLHSVGRCCSCESESRSRSIWPIIEGAVSDSLTASHASPSLKLDQYTRVVKECRPEHSWWHDACKTQLIRANSSIHGDSTLHLAISGHKSPLSPQTRVGTDAAFVRSATGMGRYRCKIEERQGKEYLYVGDR